MTISTAVILAAGRGTRLAGAGLDVPKGLVEIGGETLVGRSVRLLQQRGITDVLLVTGHQAQLYEAFAAARQGVRCLYNPNYSAMGSLESLCCALNVAANTFLLLDSDILYEGRGLDALLKDPAENAALISSPTGSGDEFYVWTDGSQSIHHFSKSLADKLEAPAGEHVGILKVGVPLQGAMLSRAHGKLRREPVIPYESLLIELLSEHPVKNVFVPNLLWSEIDNEEMLMTARNVVWPGLLALGDR
jgi:2-aminoethylphosphonate-pyruvate transaminase